jgi:hypothetical protein
MHTQSASAPIPAAVAMDVRVLMDVMSVAPFLVMKKLMPVYHISDIIFATSNENTKICSLSGNKRRQITLRKYAKLPSEKSPNYLTVDIYAYFCYHLRRYGQL